jgi:exonuclease VII small subunit
MMLKSGGNADGLKGVVRTFGQNQPVLLDKTEAAGSAPSGAAAPEAQGPAVRVRPTRFGAVAMAAAFLTSLFWVGVFAAFLWGWLGPRGLAALDPVRAALFVAGALLPPVLFMAVAATLARSAAMHEATRSLLAATDRLFAADEAAAGNAARLARFIRRELDSLNTGLDAAAQRMRALEQVLESQIATLDAAGARAEVRGQSIASRLAQESQRMEGLGDNLNAAATRASEMIAARMSQENQRVEALGHSLNAAAARAGETIAAQLAQENQRVEAIGEVLVAAAARASETIAGRAAQLKAMMESAESTLKMATQSLDVQAAGFRAAVTTAAEAPHQAAVALDRQASRIAEVADGAASRAEFVLARQEKQRTQLSEIMQRLEQEGERLDNALSQQRRGLEQAVAALAAEARKCEAVTGDADRQLELLMVSATTRAEQLTGAFAREAERLKDAGDAAAVVLAQLSAALKEAGTGAQTLIGESAAQAKQDARLLVGEAMAECERLLRAAGEMSAEAGKIRGVLAKTTEDVERHLIRLPGLAQEEARRMRQLIAGETEQLLDISARAMATLHARSGVKPQLNIVAAPEAEPARSEPESEGLRGLARKLTARQKRERSEGKTWEMKALLAAAEQGDEARLKAGGAQAASLAALEAALSDLAINLAALDEQLPGTEEWKQYLMGDRSVFARRLAGTIDAGAVDRITTLYRDDKQFHDAADAYISEFEMLLDRAREGDSGGLLTSTLLSADTGKVYLAVAYALGRL